MQEQSQITQSTKIQEIIQLKQWQQAEELVLQYPKTNQLLQRLVNLYDKLFFDDEEEYEHFLRILLSAIDIHSNYKAYEAAVSAIVSQIISLSSMKYAIVIIRGLVSQLQNNDMAVLAVLANVYLFSGLIFDPTYSDLESIYEELKKASQKINQQLLIQSLQNGQIKHIIITALSHLIKNILNEAKAINAQRKQIAIRFVSKIIKDLNKDFANDSSNQQLTFSIIGLPLSKIPLVLLQSQQINVTKCQLPLLFLQAISSQQRQRYTSSVLSKKSIVRIVLLMVCSQLSGDLTEMPDLSLEQCITLSKSVLKVVQFLDQQMKRDSYQFLCQNSCKVQEFVQKVNIFLGAIDPKEQMSKQLTKRFLPLSFLPRQFKQKLLSKLIKKHKNENFKIHLISQYRKLLTFKTPKDTWIRSTDILLQQLSNLEPRSSLDYIGHILSFAYYWKEVGNKLLKNNQNVKLIHVDTNTQMAVFSQKLTGLKSGLQNRLKLLSDEKNEQERNQISVCLYRIQEILAY